jgi:hypothetical protein
VADETDNFDKVDEDIVDKDETETETDVDEDEDEDE